MIGQVLHAPSAKTSGAEPQELDSGAKPSQQQQQRHNRCCNPVRVLLPAHRALGIAPVRLHVRPRKTKVVQSRNLTAPLDSTIGKNDAQLTTFFW
jgi:hypothetical protein